MVHVNVISLQYLGYQYYRKMLAALIYIYFYVYYLCGHIYLYTKVMRANIEQVTLSRII